MKKRYHFYSVYFVLVKIVFFIVNVLSYVTCVIFKNKKCHLPSFQNSEELNHSAKLCSPIMTISNEILQLNKNNCVLLPFFAIMMFYVENPIF